MPDTTLAEDITRAVWSTINVFNATKHWEESDIDDFYEEIRAVVEAKIKERIV